MKQLFSDLLLSPNHRRSCSLDVEVSASGFTKDLLRDSEVLHPAGPEEEEEEDDDDDEEEDNKDEEATDEEVEREEENVDMEEYKHAMLELEGLKVSDSHVDRQDEEEEEVSEKREEQKESETAPAATRDDKPEEGLEEELKEAVDECPELSASNKEFKPFR